MIVIFIEFVLYLPHYSKYNIIACVRACARMYSLDTTMYFTLCMHSICVATPAGRADGWLHEELSIWMDVTQQ